MEKQLINVDLKGRNVLVTGGAKDIGEAISRVFADNGANIAVNYNTSAKRAQALVKEFQVGSIKAVAIQADVSDSEQAERLIDQAEDAWRKWATTLTTVRLCIGLVQGTSK